MTPSALRRPEPAVLDVVLAREVTLDEDGLTVRGGGLMEVHPPVLPSLLRLGLAVVVATWAALELTVTVHDPDGAQLPLGPMMTSDGTVRTAAAVRLHVDATQDDVWRQARFAVELGGVEVSRAGVHLVAVTPDDGGAGRRLPLVVRG